MRPTAELARPRMRPSRSLAVAAGAVIVVVVVAAIVWWPRSGTGSAPYTDPAATGRLALCSRNGTQLTSGSTTAVPFAWRAVGETAAPGGYDGAGRSATLFAYQPRAGVSPEEWSGRTLTASAAYTNPAHPMAAATDRDTDLQAFLTAYPPSDGGFVQLRLYLTAPGRPALTTAYDSLDLKIQGDRWTATGGRQLSCTSGSATSLESQFPTHG
jgi:hypothetical protein